MGAINQNEMRQEKVICDRCSKMIIEISSPAFADHEQLGNLKNYDLCRECNERFLKFIKRDEKKEEIKNEEENEKYTPIETLQFSVRTLNALINGSIGSVEQLIRANKTTPRKIIELRGLGTKGLGEITQKLIDFNYNNK